MNLDKRYNHLIIRGCKGKFFEVIILIPAIDWFCLQILKGNGIVVSGIIQNYESGKRIGSFDLEDFQV